MEFQACVLFTLALVSNVLITWSASVSSSVGGNSMSIGGKYTVITKSTTKKGKCIMEITIKGDGVDDIFEHPCEKESSNLLTTDNVMVLGDPKKNKLSLFSDAPSTIVVIKDNKCTKKTYKTKGSKTSSTSKIMTSTDCAAVKKKIYDEQEKNRIYWEQWNANFNQQMANAFPPGFPFHNQPTNSNNNKNNHYQTNNNNNYNSGMDYDYENSYGSSGSFNYDPSTAGNDWGTNFSNQMNALMSSIFRPGFPFA